MSPEEDNYSFSVQLLGAEPVRHLNQTQVRATITAMRELAGILKTDNSGPRPRLAGLACIPEGPVDRELARFLLR